MKLQTIAFLSLITLSTLLSSTASADCFDGFSNGNSHSNMAGNTIANANTQSRSNAKANGWGISKGDANGEIDLNINFKAKAKTKMFIQSAENIIGNTSGSGEGLINCYNISTISYKIMI